MEDDFLPFPEHGMQPFDVRSISDLFEQQSEILSNEGDFNSKNFLSRGSVHHSKLNKRQ